MQLSDFDFDLPDDLIALHPAKPRRSARLLVSMPDTKEPRSDRRILDSSFEQLQTWLNPGDLLVFNDTKVLPARLFGHRQRVSDGTVTGLARVEVTLMRAMPGGQRWEVMAKPLRKLKIDDEIVFANALTARVSDLRDGLAVLDFTLEPDRLLAEVAAQGHMPLPPYIANKREVGHQDLEDYQTVFAQNLGAVAAPTASLHFDDIVLKQLSQAGINTCFVTLHVGAGTFLPVKVDDIAEHKMHAEWGDVQDGAVAAIRQTKQHGGRVIPVGTTALRLIETAARSGEIGAFQGETDIFIYPGFQFHVADGLITNFHLPKSTLLMLVAALVGKAELDAIYAHAITHSYRFYSYGDTSLLLR